MGKFKKTIGIFLSIALIVFYTSSFSYAVDSNTINIYSENISSDSGEIITVPIYIDNNNGFAGFRVSIHYDTEAFTPVSVTKGTVLSSINNGYFNDSIGGSINDRVDIVWTSASNINENGLLFSVSFQVNNTAHDSYRFSISYNQDDTFDSSFNDVIFDCSDFEVYVDNSSYLSAQKFFIPETTCSNGQNVCVPIMIENNQGTTAVSFEVCYDKDIFTPVQINSGIANVLSNNINSANGKLQIIVGEISSTAVDNTAFVIVFNVSRKAYGIFNISLNNSMGYISEGAKITVNNDDINAPANVFTDNIIVPVAANKVSVPIKIKNNYGIMGYKMSFTYDQDILYPTKVELGNSFDGNFDYNIRYGTGEIVVVWNNSENEYDDDELFVISFNILSHSTEKTALSATYSQNDTFNEDWKSVQVTFGSMDVYFEPEDLLTSSGNIVVSSETGFICGFPAGAVNIADYVQVKNGYNMVLSNAHACTGSVVDIYNNDILIKSYYVLIFGDINGDGWYDGMDSIIVSCLANEMLKKADIAEVQYFAADCNHDGVIDNLDVDLLQQAGVLLTDVDQSKSEEELLETSSAYVEYLNLIDQMFETEITEVNEEVTAEGQENTEVNILTWLFNFIVKIFNYLKIIIK